ncbi:MAG TPA: glycosyl hydrolase family 65 protein [Acidimicrobiia bacterium]
MIRHRAFPVEPWHVRERGFHRSRLGAGETVFSVSNGYLGLRGNLDELRPVYQSGTYVNAFYEEHPIVYAESAYGFDQIDQTMVPATDGKVIRLSVAGEPLDITGGELVHHERVLDLRAGTVTRELEWVSPGGHRIRVRSRRLASFAQPHLACIEWSVEVVDRPCELVVVSELTTERHDAVVKGDPRVGPAARPSEYQHVLESADRLRLVLGRRTHRSRRLLVAGVDHRLEDDAVSQCTTDTTLDEVGGRVTFTIDARPARPWALTKYLVYHDTARRPAEALRARVEADLDRAGRRDFAAHARTQAQRLGRLWDRCDVVVEGDRALQQAVRFAVFQVLQATARADGRGIPAKGLTGPGYEGQTFWDMDAYVLSMLSFTAPELSRRALEARYGMLGHARRRARQLGHRGAMFPWRTITGEPGSAYFPAGTAAYHINADVAYALETYVGATGDREFLYGKGAEMLVETARLWVDLGYYSERVGGRFRIHGVTGPDEYTAMVHDNTYTNLMACANLEFAADTVVAMQRDDPERHAQLVRRAGLEDDEPEQWRRAAANIYVCFDEELGLHGQDHSFLYLEPWDFAGTPANRYPLLLHYHPLEIYRHQVIKQADLVLAMFFQGHRFTPEQKRRNFDYYDPLTTGDSSLSPSIQAIMAFEVGHLDLGLEYARLSALMDLDDVNHNVRDGVHVAAMAGAWMALVHGVGGMRERAGVVSFAPRLPAAWQRLCFRLVVRGRVLSIDVGASGTTYTLLEGDELEVEHRGERVTLRSDHPVALA